MGKILFVRIKGTQMDIDLFFLFMLSEQKSSVEIVAYPYNRLTTLYFLLRFPQRFLAAGNKNRDFWSFFCVSFFFLDNSIIRKFVINK